MGHPGGVDSCEKDVSSWTLQRDKKRMKEYHGILAKNEGSNWKNENGFL